jgi:hypothetical protein
LTRRISLGTEQTMIYAILFGILPAIFIVGITDRIHDSVSGDTDAERWLVTLLGVLAVTLTTLVITTSSDSPPSSFMSMMLIPVTCGILTSIFHRLFSDRVVWHRPAPRTILLSLIVVSLLVLLGTTFDLTALMTITTGGLFLALVWKIWTWIGSKVLLVWGIQMILLWFSIWTVDAHIPLIESPDWLSGLIQMTVIFLIPSMAVTIAAGLLYSIILKGLIQDWRRILFISALIVSILTLMGYQIFLASVWDVSTDGFFGIFILMVVSSSAIAIAMLMAWVTPDKRVLFTIVFALLVPLSMRYALWLGSHSPNGEWGESPAHITEQRAEGVAHAIQQFYAEHGYYPQSLDDLLPQILVYIPRPLMIPGQTWCYEGGSDFYRLGYVYRQYFSTPALVVIHASSGQPPNQGWPCDKAAAKYPAPPGYYDP